MCLLACQADGMSVRLGYQEEERLQTAASLGQLMGQDRFGNIHGALFPLVGVCSVHSLHRA